MKVNVFELGVLESRNHREHAVSGPWRWGSTALWEEGKTVQSVWRFAMFSGKYPSGCYIVAYLVHPFMETVFPDGSDLF